MWRPTRRVGAGGTGDVERVAVGRDRDLIASQGQDRQEALRDGRGHPTGRPSLASFGLRGLILRGLKTEFHELLDGFGARGLGIDAHQGSPCQNATSVTTAVAMMTAIRPP